MVNRTMYFSGELPALKKWHSCNFLKRTDSFHFYFFVKHRLVSICVVVLVIKPNDPILLSVWRCEEAQIIERIGFEVISIRNKTIIIFQTKGTAG